MLPVGLAEQERQRTSKLVQIAKQQIIDSNIETVTEPIGLWITPSKIILPDCTPFFPQISKADNPHKIYVDIRKRMIYAGSKEILPLANELHAKYAQTDRNFVVISP